MSVMLLSGDLVFFFLVGVGIGSVGWVEEFAKKLVAEIFLL